MKRVRNILIGAVIIGIIAVTFYFNRQFKSFTGLDMAQPKKASIVRDQILADDGVGILLFDEKGEKEEIASLPGPLYCGTENYIFTVEGEVLSIIHPKKKSVKEVILEEPVFDMKGHKDTVTLSNNLFQQTIDENGEILSHVEEKDGFMVFSAVDNSKRWTAYTSLREEEGRIVSILYLLEDGELFFRHELVDQIIVQLDFIGEDLLVATNTNIYLFDGASIRSQIFVSDLTSVTGTDDRIYILEKEKLSVYDHDFILKDRQTLEKEDFNLINSKNKCYLYNKDEILEVETNLLTPISVEGEIVKLLKYKNHLYIVYPEAIEYLN